MFGTQKERLSGVGYITLNIIRVLNIISLFLVGIASWIMLVMTIKTSSFFFFDGISHFATSVIACFLIVSECSIFKSYFVKNWPTLGPESGFVYLGLTMIVLGFNTLGNLNKSATSATNLGLPLWRVVIAAGVLCTTAGFLNIIATYIFCNSKLGITGRQVRGEGATTYPKSSSGSMFSTVSSMQKGEEYYNRPTSPEERRKSRFPFRFPISISKPILHDTEQGLDDRHSPVIPDLQRPPTAQHPALNVPEMPERPERSYPQSSRYSEVSDMTRF